MSENYNKSIKKFYSSWMDYVYNWNQLYIRYNANLSDSISKAFNENNASFASLVSEDMRNKIRKSFDKNFRKEMKDEGFINSLSKTMDSWFALSDYYGINKSYQIFIDLFSSWNKILEPLRDSLNRTESEIIPMNGRYHLLHYKSNKENHKKTPILIVYSLINRHYILDLLPEVSVVKHFIDAGFDVYATDWETPSTFDKDLTLENYIHEYVENSVNKVGEITGYEKITLFGYCWGGIFSLIYSTMHPQTVKNLVLHATPLDLEKPDTIIEKWTQRIIPDIMVDKLGNVPGQLLNFAFMMRNPLENILKYPNYFQKPRSVEEIKQFFAIESWLYDSRPISGKVYSEIIKKIYHQNQLIKGQMQVGKRKVDLENLKMPVLNIVGASDDLVPPDSSKYVMCEIPSVDKELIEYPTGHVGLCISKKAHKELWPKVVDWIKKRS
ncbi:MAG: alpha/beta fold hydrolase [Candidatus Nitrosomaritimum aestuariumsis]|jgi:class III poly(R)-hydroxyalkanoic acid synthase PhaC subunit